MNNGYSICFNQWALDKDIKNELNLLLIISSLCAEKGYCFASNQYLAELFDITEVSVSNKIKKLEQKGYIEIDYEKYGCKVISRQIRLKNILTDDYKIFYSAIKNNFKDNNISINNKKETINNKLLIVKKENKIPTLEEVEKYCKDRKNNIDPKKFYDYYSINNWKDKDGKQVKNWKQKIITWEGRQVKQVVKIDNTPEWFNQDLEINKATLEEQEEMKSIINNY